MLSMFEPLDLSAHEQVALQQQHQHRSTPLSDVITRVHNFQFTSAAFLLHLLLTRTNTNEAQISTACCHVYFSHHEIDLDMKQQHQRCAQQLLERASQSSDAHDERALTAKLLSACLKWEQKASSTMFDSEEHNKELCDEIRSLLSQHLHQFDRVLATILSSVLLPQLEVSIELASDTKDTTEPVASRPASRGIQNIRAVPAFVSSTCSKLSFEKPSDDKDALKTIRAPSVVISTGFILDSTNRFTLAPIETSYLEKAKTSPLACATVIEQACASLIAFGLYRLAKKILSFFSTVCENVETLDCWSKLLYVMANKTQSSSIKFVHPQLQQITCLALGDIAYEQRSWSTARRQYAEYIESRGVLIGNGASDRRALQRLIVLDDRKGETKTNEMQRWNALLVSAILKSQKQSNAITTEECKLPMLQKLASSLLQTSSPYSIPFLPVDHMTELTPASLLCLVPEDGKNQTASLTVLSKVIELDRFQQLPTSHKAWRALQHLHLDQPALHDSLLRLEQQSRK